MRGYIVPHIGPAGGHTIVLDEKYDVSFTGNVWHPMAIEEI